MTSTLRQKRFRRFMFSEEELREHQDELKKTITPLYEKWQNAEISPPEVVAQYIVQFLKIFRPRDFRGGPHNVNLSSEEMFSLSPTVMEFAQISFRSTPLAVNRALVNWAAGRWRLRLLDYIPDSRTLLKWQAAGERVVTCFFSPEKLTKWVEGKRDPLGFVLHDLIHADHFFGKQEWFEGQKQFYQETLVRLDRGDFDQILAGDQSELFEYIISDMNSHPAHLRQTLDLLL